MALENIMYLTGLNPGFLAAIFIWTLIWKGLALWYAAKNEQRIWFIAFLLVQSVGILPIIYLFIFSKTPIVQEMRAMRKSRGSKRSKKRKR
jgi:hypothetical protein